MPRRRRLQHSGQPVDFKKIPAAFGDTMPGKRRRTVSRKFPPLTVVVVLLLFPLAGTAQQKADRLEPMDVFRVQVASDPQISPDGKRVVYVRQSADISSDHRVSNLWVVNFDGSEHRPLTTGTYNDSSPRWSPDGTRIAFISDRDGNLKCTSVGWIPDRSLSSQTLKMILGKW
jgi:hypothetical protein